MFCLLPCEHPSELARSVFPSSRSLRVWCAGCNDTRVTGCLDNMHYNYNPMLNDGGGSAGRLSASRVDTVPRDSAVFGCGWSAQSI